MARTRYGTSLWAAHPPAARSSFPRLSGTATADVAIVGGGLAGLTIATVFARAGVRVLLLEADRIGGQAASDAGWLPAYPGVPFRTVQQTHGLRRARRLFDESRKAALGAAALLRRLAIKCDLAAVDAVQWARTKDEEIELKRERQARIDAGLDAAWMTARALTVSTRLEGGVAGLKTRGDFICDPARAAAGLAAAAIKAGAQLHEKSEVTRIRVDRQQVELRTRSAVVSASSVLLATGDPGPGAASLRRHTRLLDGYAVATPPLPAALRQAMGARGAAPPALVLQDLAEGPRTLRYTKDGRAIFSGADQPSVAPRLREKALLQRAGQLMYELSLAYPAISGLQPEFAWQARRVTGIDGLPLIGPHRNFPRHLFAIGLGRTGVSGAFLAARILLRRYQEEPPEPHDELFGFGRL